MSSYEEMALAYQFYGLIITGGIGLLQCALIGGGLLMMHQAGQRRDRQLDRQEKVLEEIGAGIREQSAGIRALLERPAQ